MKIDLWEIIKTVWPMIKLSWPLWVFILCLGIIRIGLDQLGYEIDDWKIRRKFRQGEQWRTEREIIILARGPRTAREIRQFAGSNFRDFEYLKYLLKMEEENK